MISFPKWANRAAYTVLTLIPLLVVGVITAFAYYISPYSTQVGYQPKQPIAYSHKLHAGDLGIDCRYCHVNVERSPVAMVPPPTTCLNCHSVIRKDSPEILKIQEAVATGRPIQWVRIHRLPDFVYFDHSVHLNAGVGCVSCHGRIDRMETVEQDKPLSMGWCLGCHRQPERYLRPKDKVTDMNWMAEDQLSLGTELKEARGLAPTTNCSGCHR